MSEEYKRRSQMQDVEEPPVIENRNKRPMSGSRARPRRMAGKAERMPEGELAAPAVGIEVMPLTPAEALVTPIPPAEMSTLEAKPVASTGEHYVRLRVRVEGDQMEVVGAKLVEGPLVRPERLHVGLVYEAAIGEKQVTVDSIPDAGVRRSFPSPGPEGAEMGHHIEELPSYEFAVRIPQQQLSEQALRKLRISLYQVKGRVPDERMTGHALLEQFPAELRLVAELRGVRVDDLPPRVQAEIKKSVQR